MSGRISFIGAGPGAADLITVRGARRIAEADVVIWSASLVAPECVHEHARADAELVDSARLTLEEAIEIYRRGERDKLKVARVHSGDPSLWGAVQEQYDACARMAVEVEIVPGVAAFSAVAAEIGRELTVPGLAQSLVVTRLEADKTPMPDGEKVREFARHGTTMALFLSAARAGQLVEELRAGGYADDVPVVVAYKVTWPDELMLRTTLGELEATVKQQKLWRSTLFIVGRALDGSSTRSHYNSGHTYRGSGPAARKARPTPTGSERRRPARSGAGSPDSASGNSDLWPEAVPGPRTEHERSQGKSDSDVAWWAVREWQQTARDTARATAARPSVTRKATGNGSAQADLFIDSETAMPEGMPVAVEVQPEGAPSDVIDYTAVTAETGLVEPGLVESSAEPEPPEMAPEAERAPETIGAAAPEAVAEETAVGDTEATPLEQENAEPAAQPTRSTAARRKTGSARAEAKAEPKTKSRAKPATDSAKSAAKPASAKSGETKQKAAGAKKSGGGRRKSCAAKDEDQE